MANLSNIVSLCNLNNKNFAYKPAECNAENAGQWLDIVIDTTDSFKKKLISYWSVFCEQRQRLIIFCRKQFN